MKFSKEPIIWIAAFISCLIVLRDLLDGGDISQDSLGAAIVAIGAVIGRQFVTPVDKE